MKIYLCSYSLLFTKSSFCIESMLIHDTYMVNRYNAFSFLNVFNLFIMLPIYMYLINQF